MAPFGVGRKLEDQVSPFDVFEAGGDGFAVDLDVDGAVLDGEDDASKNPLAIGARTGEVNLGELTPRPLVIARRAKGAVEPGGADLEVVAVRNDVGDVERGREIARDFGEDPEVDRFGSGDRNGRRDLAGFESADPAVPSRDSTVTRRTHPELSIW